MVCVANSTESSGVSGRKNLSDSTYRYYNASLGRWISRDPIEEKGFETQLPYLKGKPWRRSVYRYVNNAPLSAYDALGLISRCIIGTTRLFEMAGPWYEGGEYTGESTYRNFYRTDVFGRYTQYFECFCEKEDFDMFIGVIHQRCVAVKELRPGKCGVELVEGSDWDFVRGEVLRFGRGRGWVPEFKREETGDFVADAIGGSVFPVDPVPWLTRLGNWQRECTRRCRSLRGT